VEVEEAAALLIYRKSPRSPHYSSVHNLRCIVTRNHALYLARTRRGSHTIETKVPKGRKNCTVKREVIKLLG